MIYLSDLQLSHLVTPISFYHSSMLSLHQYPSPMAFSVWSQIMVDLPEKNKSGDQTSQMDSCCMRVFFLGTPEHRMTKESRHNFSKHQPSKRLLEYFSWIKRTSKIEVISVTLNSYSEKNPFPWFVFGNFFCHETKTTWVVTSHPSGMFWLYSKFSSFPPTTTPLLKSKVCSSHYLVRDKVDEWLKWKCFLLGKWSEGGRESEMKGTALPAVSRRNKVPDLPVWREERTSEIIQSFGI